MKPSITHEERMELMARTKRVAKLIEEFKLFCMDSMMDGHADLFEEDVEFLKVSLAIFEGLEDESEEK